MAKSALIPVKFHYCSGYVEACCSRIKYAETRMMIEFPAFRVDKMSTIFHAPAGTDRIAHSIT